MLGGLVGDYLFTTPSTLSDIAYLLPAGYFYAGYGLVIPENITTIPNGYHIGSHIRYLDLNNVQTIESDGIRISDMKELTIPNSVSRIDEYGINTNTDIIINIDNTEEYVESHWDSNWLNTYGGYNVTVNYLR